ncbi:MAG TPA: MATE family efflux transporter [Gaiellaceae bacterium]|nr:MATE family efflux transporter [Gaiellaceae bacterium]
MSAVSALRRSPHDREIFRLAVLALGALAAQPLFTLTDTAIVGHLGTSQLAALGIAGVVLGGVFAIFNFLAYGTTSQVTRAAGAGARETADRLGAQAFWLSFGIGCVVALALELFAVQAVALMGGEGETADHAVTYLRIAVIGLPFAFLVLGGQGYFRGISDLRTPLVIEGAANALNVVLVVLFVYGFGWGIAGSAAGTAIAQACMGLAFLARMLRATHGRFRFRFDLLRRLLGVGKHLFVRTAALYVSFLVAGAVAARFGDESIGAHQIAFQLWVFLALLLDGIAIAGQVIVGRMLGAGDADGAFAASARMIVLTVYLGVAFAGVMLVFEGQLPRIFTSDEAVIAEARELWPIFALMQPLNGAVFALDGILIGAGDARYLMWSMLASMAAAVAVALAALAYDWGIVGVWLALLVLICVRLTTLGARFSRRRWLVTGWA